MDKATGKPSTDSTVISKFVQKLKSLAAGQNARFVDYKADKGIWRFRVDHFSRWSPPLKQECMAINNRKKGGICVDINPCQRSHALIQDPAHTVMHRDSCARELHVPF